MFIFKMKIYSFMIWILDGLIGNSSINPRFTISHLDDVKWYIFINIHITVLEIYMCNLVIANLILPVCIQMCTFESV